VEDVLREEIEAWEELEGKMDMRNEVIH